MKKKIYLSVLMLFLILFFGLLFGIFYIKYYFKQQLNILDNKTVFVEKGSSFYKAINILHKEEIINNKLLFEIGARFFTNNKLKVVAGEYYFDSSMKIIDVLDNLLNGNVLYRRITFAEGLSTHSIVKKINENEFLLGDNIEFNEEGVLLPETYIFTYGETKQSLLNRMINNMNKVIDELWETRQENLPIKNKYEALILASIVEKETGVPEERPLIASVFVNRLKKVMHLQTDPTIIYSFAFGDVSKERTIYRSDLKRPSVYNTYLNYGLPPTPIANAGIESIKAVLNPANSDYLYFVATGNGGHNFSKTYFEHRKHVKNYRNIVNNN